MYYLLEETILDTQFDLARANTASDIEDYCNMLIPFSDASTLTSGSVVAIDFSDLVFVEQLVEGTFAVTFKGLWKSQDKSVAIRKIAVYLYDPKEVRQ